MAAVGLLSMPLGIVMEMPLKIVLATGIHQATKMGIPTPIPMGLLAIPIAPTALAIAVELAMTHLLAARIPMVVFTITAAAAA
jgi:hypothetical protein